MKDPVAICSNEFLKIGTITITTISLIVSAVVDCTFCIFEMLFER